MLTLPCWEEEQYQWAGHGPTSASYQGMMGEREQEEVLAMDFRDMQS